MTLGHQDRSAAAVVLTMVQRPPVGSSLPSLTSVEARRVILLNDDRDPKVEEELKRQCDVLLTPGRNLGVAVGRNRLFKAAMDLGAEVLVVLDDDIHVPPDYVKKIVEHLDRLRRSSPSNALIGPAVLSAAALPPMGSETSRAFSRRVRRSGPLQVRHVDHLGVSSWRSHYLRAHGDSAAVARRIITGVSLRSEEIDGAGRNNPALRDLIGKRTASPILTDVVAGGTWVLPARLVDAIGWLDERMGGFGYEDTDFCLRARRTGYTHHVIPSIPVLHDRHRRGSKRSLADTLHRRGRFRGLLAPQLDGSDRETLLVESLALVPFEVAGRVQSQRELESTVGAAHRGLAEGLLAGSADLEIRVKTSSGLLVETIVALGTVERIMVTWPGGSLITRIGPEVAEIETDHSELRDLLSPMAR